MSLSLNHITFAVRDLPRSLSFYCGLLGFRKVAQWRYGAYLRSGDLWLILLCSPEREGPPPRKIFTGSFRASSIGRSDQHIALTCSGEDFGTLGEGIIDSGVVVRQEQTTEGPVLFFADPDGHKLELHVCQLQARIDAARGNSDMEFFD